MITPENTHPAAQDNVEAILLDIFRKHLKTEGTNWDASTTMEQAQVDSFDLVELVFEIEDRFGIEVSFNANSGATNEMTLGHVAEMVRSGLAKTGSASRTIAGESAKVAIA